MYPLQGLLAKARVRGRRNHLSTPPMEGVRLFGSHFPRKKNKQLYTPPKNSRLFSWKIVVDWKTYYIFDIFPFCLGAFVYWKLVGCKAFSSNLLGFLTMAHPWTKSGEGSKNDGLWGSFCEVMGIGKTRGVFFNRCLPVWQQKTGKLFWALQFWLLILLGMFDFWHVELYPICFCPEMTWCPQTDGVL